METGRAFIEGIRKLVKEKQPAVKVIHLSKYAEQEIRRYMIMMDGRSFRKESEEIADPLKTLLGYPVQIHSEPPDEEYWIEDENS